MIVPGRAGWSVVGVEAAESRAVSAAMAAGRVVPVEVGQTIADGLRRQYGRNSRVDSPRKGAEDTSISDRRRNLPYHSFDPVPEIPVAFTSANPE